MAALPLSFLIVSAVVGETGPTLDAHLMYPIHLCPSLFLWIGFAFRHDVLRTDICVWGTIQPVVSSQDRVLQTTIST